MDKVFARVGLEPQAAWQYIRYGISGVSAVIVDYGSFAVLIGVIKAPLIVGTIVSLVAGFIVSFLMNRLWVFGAHTHRASNKAVMQLLLYGLLFSFNTAFTYLFIDLTGKWLELSPYIAKLCCIMMIMVWNFILYKRVIFRLTKSDDFQAM